MHIREILDPTGIQLYELVPPGQILIYPFSHQITNITMHEKYIIVFIYIIKYFWRKNQPYHLQNDQSQILKTIKV